MDTLKKKIAELINTFVSKVSIEERPSIVHSKERCGVWEVDTIIGKNGKGAILTQTERKTSFLIDGKTCTWNAGTPFS